MVQRIAILANILWLASCAVAPPLPSTDAALNRCLDLYQAFDQAVAAHGTTPSMPRRMAGFPYLRVDRFLAHYREQSLNSAEQKTWLARLADADRASRYIELQSLPTSTIVALTDRFAPSGDLSAALASCSQKLQQVDRNHPQRLTLIRERAVVPDDYHTAQRVLGLYPLSALPVSYGVARWHGEAKQMFAVPLQTLPVRGDLVRFQPPKTAADDAVDGKWTNDALGIPQVATAQLNALYNRYAPVWEIDVAGDFDRPGVPHWQANGSPTVKVGEPTSYRYLSYTTWQGQVLLQLNYLVWFAERPLSGPLDILGGALDGLVWRVTLDEQGQPLLYDSIHPCGCYHHFFPTLALRLHSEAFQLPEPPLMPQYAPQLRFGERLVIRVQSGTHYLQRVYADQPTGQTYVWREYWDLYATPAPNQRHISLFEPTTGLVSGTERLERFILWPMGVPSPGAMRERGRQATAFVGRRHFDDADLLEQFFEPVNPTLTTQASDNTFSLIR